MGFLAGNQRAICGKSPYESRKQNSLKHNNAGEKGIRIKIHGGRNANIINWEALFQKSGFMGSHYSFWQLAITMQYHQTRKEKVGLPSIRMDLAPAPACHQTPEMDAPGKAFQRQSVASLLPSTPNLKPLHISDDDHPGLEQCPTLLIPTLDSPETSDGLPFANNPKKFGVGVPQAPLAFTLFRADDNSSTTVEAASGQDSSAAVIASSKKLQRKIVLQPRKRTSDHLSFLDVGADTIVVQSIKRPRPSSFVSLDREVKRYTGAGDLNYSSEDEGKNADSPPLSQQEAQPNRPVDTNHSIGKEDSISLTTSVSEENNDCELAESNERAEIISLPLVFRPTIPRDMTLLPPSAQKWSTIRGAFEPSKSSAFSPGAGVCVRASPALLATNS
jgi:hypothetical protein